MKKLITFITLATILLASCNTKPYYQVYEVQSNNVALEDSMFKDVNDEYEITYNLWTEGGDLSFSLYNKTDKNLYVVLPKSSYILNGMAHDYYTDASFTQSVAVASQASYIRGYNLTKGSWNPTKLTRLFSLSSGFMSQKAVTTKEQAIICIPPKSAKVIKGFNILDVVYKDCDNAKENYPKTSSTLITYNQDNSPLTFRNRIAYSFNENGSEEKYIDHNFWIASFQNFAEKEAFTEIKYMKCEATYQEKAKVFTMGTPYKFYNKYNFNLKAK